MGSKRKKDVFKISILKKTMTRLRTSVKLISLVGIASVIIIAAVSLIYKPTYSVTLNGEFLGYIENKSKLQKQINDYIKNGSEEHVAFVDIEEMPEYHLCLLKKDVVTNDEDIYEQVKSLGTVYYRYYAVLEDKEEKAFVETSEQAEEIIEQLKKKLSDNQDKLTYIEVCEPELKEFVTVDSAVASLYKQPVVKKAAVKVSTAKVNTSTKISNEKKSIGIGLIKPISGTITSRFGSRSSMRVSAHTGLDVAAPKGTPIKAAASGTVIYSGYKGSYGNLVVVSHGNGVQTYYGHCSTLCVSAGDKVSQGAVIAKVGSTGNSSGNHLHIEIRLNGVALNPQNYLY